MNDSLDDLRKLDLPFNIDEVTTQCHQCIRDQLKKYENSLDEEGNPTKDRFIVPCKGIKKTLIDSDIKATMTDEQYNKLLASKDIVKFAEKFLIEPVSRKPWIARDYQEAILRCTSKRKVLRCSRRIGKCVSEKSKIFTNIGPLTPKEILFKQKNKECVLLASFDVDENKFKFTDVFDIQSNGRKQTYELTTLSGRENFITSNHPFLTFSETGELEWKELKDLSEGDYIASPSSYEELPFGKDIGNKYSRLLGYLIGDGSTNYSHSVSFTNFDYETINDFTDIISDYNCELSEREKGNFVVISKDKHKKYRNKINALVTKADIRSLAKHKTIPKEIFSSSKENIANFLGAYWDCDGWCSVCSKPSDKYHKLPSIQIGCTSASKELITGIYHLLLRLGICARMSFRITTLNGKNFDAWTLDINSADGILNFAKTIPLRAKKKNLQKVINIAEQRIHNLKGPLQYIPEQINNYIYKKCKENKILPSYIFNKNHKKTNTRSSLTGNIIKRKLKNAAENLQDNYLEGLCNSNILWDKIKYIRPIGEEETYDVCVPETNTLISDDIISHNTSLVCVEICYYLYTHKRIKIIVVGPQKKHAEDIFNRIREFIHARPLLSDAVIKDVASPYPKIKLKNGSTVEGYAGGSDSGNKRGVSIRGSDADIIYLEEADYIDEESVRGAVLPILMTTPDVKLVAFSTPSGFKTLYYNWCLTDPHYKEYYYDYTVLPWYKTIEAERHSFTEEKWNHEFLALFSESEAGVYKTSYIDRALRAYHYKDIIKVPSWRYCMGVDWNEKHGAEIVVVGHNNFTGKFQVVDAICIERTQFTQLSSVKKVIEMNRKWSPSFVYADAGNGSTNIELLRKMSFEARTKTGDTDTGRLLDTLKKYDSGASLKTKDPITHQEIKQPAKPFMVNASVRLFEQGLIIISSADKILEDQLRNYVVSRMTPTRVPVYGMQDEKIGDHRLDALNLAIVAFYLNFNDLNVIQNVDKVCHVIDSRLRDRLLNINNPNLPASRSGEGDFEKSEAEKILFPSNIGGSDPRLNGIKINKGQYDSGKDLEMAIVKFINRRRIKGRQQRSRARPKRTNI